MAGRWCVRRRPRILPATHCLGVWCSLIWASIGCAGFRAPSAVFQVVHPELRRDFPRLASLEVNTNLPVQLTSFVGREREISELCDVLTSSRLVTLTGVGGVGKTRLAQQVAAEVLPRFADGAWIVELAPVADPEVIAETIASALDIPNPGGIPAEALVVENLRRRTLLLVLDNCEHVLDRVAQLATAINQHCSDVVVLATSREGLAIPGERLYAVSALPLPEAHAPLETLTESDAVQLFIDRASAARRDFRLSAENADSVAAVCRRLDGVPLALELAAARVTALHPAQIAARLDERFKLLNAGRRSTVERHQTLRSTIDWSYDLLTPAQRVALNRLAVFARGCTLDAAEAVLADGDIDAFEVVDLLARLVEQSLVLAADVGRDQRYRLLETIRQYAAERLAETRDVGPTPLLGTRRTTERSRRRSARDSPVPTSRHGSRRTPPSSRISAKQSTGSYSRTMRTPRSASCSRCIRCCCSTPARASSTSSRSQGAHHRLLITLSGLPRRSSPRRSSCNSATSTPEEPPLLPPSRPRPRCPPIPIRRCTCRSSASPCSSAIRPAAEHSPKRRSHART